MSLKGQKLEFREDSIISETPSLSLLTGELAETEVMMEWERPLMKRHAEVVCSNGGHILEIGFGMGISANYIQELNPESHTIVESHPQVLEKLDDWAKGRSNVNIVRGEWCKNLDVLEDLGIRFDGVFYDAYGDPDVTYFRGALMSDLRRHTIPVKLGTIVTFWNNIPEEKNFHKFAYVSYEQIKINPPQNSYFNNDIYYLPKVEICLEEFGMSFF